MSDLQVRFETAQAEVRTLPTPPGNDDLLTLYALYKQATAGEAAAARRPGRLDFVGKAKYEAWSRLAGLSAEEAQRRYVATVDRLLGR